METLVTSSKPRYIWVDCAKCFSILLVISFHVPYHIDGYAGDILQLLRMPAFFMISGFLFNIDKYPSFRYFIKHRSIQLLVPYTFFFIVFYFFWLIIGRNIAGGEDLQAPMWRPLFEFFYGTPYLVVAPYWFICCLFSIQLIYYALFKYLPRAIAIAIVILCPLLHSIEGIQALPWNLPQAFLYIPFYAFSNQCKTYIATMSLSRRNCFLTCLSLMLALAGTLHIHDFGETIEDILTVACGILILPTYILFIKSIAKIFPKMKKAASFIGKNTIIILALQNYIIGVFKIILSHIGYNNGNYGMNILLTLLTVVVCIIPIQIINKYIPFSIGRGTFFEKKLKQ